MLSRRGMLKLGLCAGATAARSFADGVASPPTDPFLDPIPVPPEPTATLQPFADLAPEAEAFVDRTGRQGVARFYMLVAEERAVQFHQQLPPTRIWGYRDAFHPSWDFALGPTFRGQVSPNQFSGNVVRLVNNLPPVTPAFGVPRLSAHLHGGHQPSHSDGFPDDVFVNGAAFRPVVPPGGHFDYAYPMIDPGMLSGGREMTARPSTLWYHDHLLDFTGPNVYRGLAGFFLVFENAGVLGDTALDLGDENDARGLRLPSGRFDLPLVIQDKTFAPSGDLIYDPFDRDGFLGDRMLVNGKVQPYARVKRRRYRLRFLNGSNARFHQLFLTDAGGRSYPMTMIATEGGLLSRPLANTGSFMLAPAERVEVVVDFTMFPAGSEVFVENRLAQDDGRGPRGTFEQPEILRAGTRILKFLVEEAVPDPSLDVTRPGVRLRPFAPVPEAELRAATVREFVFDRSHGGWTINGRLVDLERPVAAPRLNAPEIWRLKNSSGGWWHPIHIHSEYGRVLSRNGRRPSPVAAERDGIAKKDTIVLGPGSEVEVFFKFRDFAGPFVFHCHNIEHEDMAMMARFDVVA